MKQITSLLLRDKPLIWIFRKRPKSQNVMPLERYSKHKEILKVLKRLKEYGNGWTRIKVNIHRYQNKIIPYHFIVLN